MTVSLVDSNNKIHQLGSFTAVIQPYKNVTQVALRAYSDKPYGLHGFLNEMTSSIRYLVGSVQSAKEISVIESKQIVNIIGSVAGDYVTGGKQVVGGDIVTGTKITGEVYAPRSSIGSGEKEIKNCPYCGQEVQRDEKFCTECGVKLR